MKVFGLAFTKMHARREERFDSRSSKNINIDFINITKDNVDIVKSDAIYNISFSYTVSYLEANAKKEKKQAEVILEGILTIGLDKMEDKDFSKTYKKKEMSNSLKEAVFNFLLRKCTPKAISMEDDLNIPAHIVIPQVRIKEDSSN